MFAAACQSMCLVRLYSTITHRKCMLLEINVFSNARSMAMMQVLEAFLDV